MAVIHKLPTNIKHTIVCTLDQFPLEIDEVICIVKFKNGDSEVLETNAPFEFKCIAKELLDYEIKQDIETDSLI